jgi:hypothetical protein
MKTELREYKFNELPIEASKFQLKKLRTFIGHDTNMGFTCDLYYEGIKIAEAFDDSWGGGVTVTTTGKLAVQTVMDINESLKDYPWIIFKRTRNEDDTVDDEGGSSPWDIESIINALIDLEDERKWIKKKTTKCIFFRTADTTEGEWRTYPRRHKVSDKVLCPRDEERLFELIMKKHPDVTQIVGLRTREDWNAS